MSDYEADTPIEIQSDIDTITVRANDFSYDDGDAVMKGFESVRLQIDTHTHAQTAEVWEALYDAAISDYCLSFRKNPDSFLPDVTVRGRFEINAEHGLAGVYIEDFLKRLEVRANSTSVDTQKVFA
jgi:hypothetical protein